MFVQLFPSCQYFMVGFQIAFPFLKYTWVLHVDKQAWHHPGSCNMRISDETGHVYCCWFHHLLIPRTMQKVLPSAFLFLLGTEKQPVKLFSVAYWLWIKHNKKNQMLVKDCIKLTMGSKNLDRIKYHTCTKKNWICE